MSKKNQNPTILQNNRNTIKQFAVLLVGGCGTIVSLKGKELAGWMSERTKRKH
jgi:hypothetical protein